MFIRFSFIRRGLAVFFLISAMVGISCTHQVYMAVYPEPINIKTIIAPGDIVRVTTKDNRKVKFKVVKVTDEAIIGDRAVTSSSLINNPLDLSPQILYFNETIDLSNISKLEEMTNEYTEGTLVIF